MQEEILNIRHHVKTMVVKALNRTQDAESAAKTLGVTSRTVLNYKKEFGIIYDKGKNEFFIKDQNTTN